jgi:hypothetical protein
MTLKQIYERSSHYTMKSCKAITELSLSAQFISQQTAIISTYSIMSLEFLKQKGAIFFDAGTEFSKNHLN